MPEVCQFLGTFFLVVVNRVPILKQYLGKSRRKFLIRLGTASSCVTMFLAFILKMTFGSSGHDQYYWLVL